jgi:hypothetical protein
MVRIAQKRIRCDKRLTEHERRRADQKDKAVLADMAGFDMSVQHLREDVSVHNDGLSISLNQSLRSDRAAGKLHDLWHLQIVRW